MGTTTNVILVTGFLGSGKTTFLNRIIKNFPEDQKLMILMNEFGEIGLDGMLIQGEDIDILEISKGSIFCVCVKTDFIRSLNEIARKIKPDVLIVESSGVANPSDLKKDLKLSIFQDRFQLKEQICIIDADCFKETYKTFISIEKQIASSTSFIINKVDLASSEQVSKIKNIIRKHNNSPEFIETSYAQVPSKRFYFNFNIDKSIDRTEKEISSLELENEINQLLENPDKNATPPDRLVSAVYSWNGKDIHSFKSILPQLPEKLVRAKGFISDKKTIHLFNLVMGRYNTEIYSTHKDITSLMNHVIFIGPPEAINELETLSKKFSGMIRKSVFDPMIRVL